MPRCTESAVALSAEGRGARKVALSLRTSLSLTETNPDTRLCSRSRRSLLRPAPTRSERGRIGIRCNRLPRPRRWGCWSSWSSPRQTRNCNLRLSWSSWSSSCKPGDRSAPVACSTCTCIDRRNLRRSSASNTRIPDPQSSSWWSSSGQSSCSSWWLSSCFERLGEGTGTT